MTFEVPALAAGFASKFDEIGPYIGFGSLVAVVAMAILVFAQGRELQRLREWAGSSPERLDALEEEIRSGAAARAGVPARPAGYVAPGAAGAPGVPGAPPRPPGTPGAPAPGAPVVGGAAVTAADAGASALSAAGTGGPPRPTPPKPTPPGVAGARPIAAASTAGGPRAATAAGAAATARERERTEGPERSIGQIIGVAVVGVVVLVALLFALGVFGGSSKNKSTEPPSGQQGTGTPTETRAATPKFPKTEMTTVVLNASGRDKLAGDVSDKIENTLRFPMDEAATLLVNGAQAPMPTTTVQYRADGSTTENRQNREAAKVLAAYVKKTVRGVRILKMTGDVQAAAGNARVAVVIGRDYAAKTPGGTTTTQDSTTGGSTGSGSTGTGSTGGAGTGSSGGTGSTSTPSDGAGQLAPQTGSGGAATGDGTGGTATP
jgi:hypothetical protein